LGAHTALRDAALLRDVLSSVSRGEPGLLAALAAYEREMIDYGFAACARRSRKRSAFMRRYRSAGLSRCPFIGSSIRFRFAKASAGCGRL